ncbi:MAG: hypothetical protein EOO62_40355 [Hymenobacter sp.]|nr:MAG: hypothetical protein EOO62_40355 [Hymenobacter sp.]
MTPVAKQFRTTPSADSIPGKVLVAVLLWVLSLLLLGLVHVAGAAGYDTLPGGWLLLEVSWALVQVMSLLRLIYCL